jgi:hypothetical protein
MKFSTSRMERLILAATGACAIGLLCFGNVFAQTAGTPPNGDAKKAPEDKTVTVNGLKKRSSAVAMESLHQKSLNPIPQPSRRGKGK